MTKKEIAEQQRSRNIDSLARAAGPLENVPGLTHESAAIVLGVRGAKAAALRFWRRGAVEAEVERVREVAHDWNNLE